MTIDSLHTTRAGADAGGVLRTFFRQIMTRAAERRSLTSLRRLDDRLLRDVGLTRDDVERMTDGL